MSRCHVAVVGCGPYGLAAAAHLANIPGLETQVFGEPMSFWKDSMPSGMYLRSAPSASDIADPQGRFTLSAFTKLPFEGHPIALETFVQYGECFQRELVPELDRRRLVKLEQYASGFRLSFDRDDPVIAERVILATGIAPFAYRPPQFRGISPEKALHTCRLSRPADFCGKRVAVIGGGQSALESAALLHESGAHVEIIMRRSNIHWLGWKERLQSLGSFGRVLYSPADVGPAGISRLVAAPDWFARLPRRMQDRIRQTCLRPAAARWLMQRLQPVPVTTRRSVLYAVPRAQSVRLTLDDYSTRMVDHVVLGTGYRINISQLRYFSSSIAARLMTVQGFPVLTRYFESSIPGLHFIGAPAAWSFGPLLYFVSGTRYCAAMLASLAKEDPRAGQQAA
jgi:FAD-dependent urate hydroxylase